MIHDFNALKLSKEAQQKLLIGARLHKQQSNIRFKILHVTKARILIGTTQDYHLSENFASEATLEERTKELFKDHVDGREILVEVKTYTPSTYELPNIPFRIRALPEPKINRNKEVDDEDTTED